MQALVLLQVLRFQPQRSQQIIVFCQRIAVGVMYLLISDVILDLWEARHPDRKCRVSFLPIESFVVLGADPFAAVGLNMAQIYRHIHVFG